MSQDPLKNVALQANSLQKHQVKTAATVTQFWAAVNQAKQQPGVTWEQIAEAVGEKGLDGEAMRQRHIRYHSKRK